jgi:hypothetical protein
VNTPVDVSSEVASDKGKALSGQAATKTTTTISATIDRAALGKTAVDEIHKALTILASHVEQVKGGIP